MNKEFIEVLLKVQAEMPVVEKTEEADAVKFTYMFAPLDKIWNKVASVLTKNGFFIRHEITNGGVVTEALHELGTMESFIPFSKEALTPQDRGKEITYYRRYNLLAIFNIQIVGEDNDAQVAKKPTQRKPEPQKATETEEFDGSLPDLLHKCSKCGKSMKYIKAGTSKAGKKYNAFYACQNQDCKNTEQA